MKSFNLKEELTKPVLKQELPHLPDFGGCEAHNASNVLNHGMKKMMPDFMFDCFNNLFKHMFPDSLIAKEIKLGRTKGSYFLTNGIAPHRRIINCMKKYPH